MPCKIITSETGQNIGVLNVQGNPSQLFNSILNSPHIQNFEEALNIYLNIEGQQEEPILQYQNPDKQLFNNYAEALKSTIAGDIKAGVDIEGKFTELFSINSDITTKSFNGLVNNLIKSNLITGETTIDVDGTKLYNPTGNSEYKKAITSDMAITTSRGALGYTARRNSAGQLYFNQNLINQRPVLGINDDIEYISQESLDSKSWEQLKRTSSDAVGILAERAYKENNRVFGDTSPIEEIEVIPENDLQVRLKELLQNLGVKTVSLEEYSKKYQQKTGIEPNAQALADIANKVIAFQNGEITTEDLTEETAHFIVEATDPVELENILRNIHKTSQWNQYFEQYNNVYSKNYSGQELDSVIRKEILGKVLADSFQDNFAQNKNTQTENTIIARLQQLFNSFIDSVRTFLKPQYQQQLDNYTKNIYNNLMSGGLYSELDESQLDGKKYVYYSIAQAGAPEEYKQLRRAVDNLSSQQYQLAKRYSAPASQNELREAKELLQEIENKEADIQETSKLKALLNIATVANAQLNYLSRAIDKNDNQGYHFAQEENSVYQNFITKVEPLLAQLNNQLNPKSRQEKQIKDRIETALKKSIELKGKVPANNTVAINNIVNRVIKKNNLTGQDEERFRQQLTDVLNTAQKDTGWFHAHLGQLVHSQNILLNLAGDVIAKTVTDERRYFLPRIKNFLNQLEAANYNPRQLKNLIDGNGYILHEVDNSKLQAIDISDQTRLYNEITGQNITEFTPSLIDSLSVEDRNLFNKEFNEIRKERLESFFTQEHLDRLENTFVELNGVKIFRRELPPIALEYEQYYRGQLTQIRTNNDGINTENDKYEIEELNKQRVKDSNPRNQDGSLKNGLREVYNEELGQYIVEYDSSTVTSDEDVLEAQKVYGLQMINLLNRKFYEGNVRQEGIPQTFIDKLNEFETEQEKWDFVQLNAYVGFKPEYWDNFGANQSLADRLSEINTDETQELLEDIRTQQQIISNILKANRVFNQPSETNVSAMSDIETSSIKDATIQLESLYIKANSFLEESERQEPFSETRLNEAFRKDLEDEGINTDDGILNHILKHVTPKNKAAIEKAQKIAAKIQKGEITNIDKSLQNTFSEDMPSEQAQTALMRFAESKLLPYYKRTEPIGYSQERQSLEEGIRNNEEGAVERFIQDTEYTQISPSYSFYGQSEAINPRWLANREAKRPQYTEQFLSKIRNDKYFERYAFDSNGAPTKNTSEYQARQALLELQDWTIENYGMTGRHDRYLLPQQRKSGARRVESFITSLNRDSIREGINDLVNFREDEAEVGQDENGNQVTNSTTLVNIPTYGLKKIDNQNDVTDELLTSFSWMAAQSALFRARSENINNMLVIQDAVLNSDFTGKDAAATNTFKMFKSFLNSSFYGQRESFTLEVGIFGKSVNLGKLAKVFNNWTKMVALFGITIPISSLYQAKVQRFIESKVGEIINPISLSLARKEFQKNAWKAAGEIMSLTSKAKINVLMETYGVYNLNERFENSNYNKAARAGLKLNSGLHALGNFNVVPTTAIAVIMDYRYSDGQIISYNQYLRRNPLTDRKQLKEDWQKLDLFYNDITVENGVQGYKKEAILQKTGWSEEDFENNINNINEVITNRASAAIQDIDTQIPQHEKSILARDARANFLLNFLSWFTLAVQKKTKNYHYSISRENYEEGNWRTTYNFLESLIIRRKDIKAAWNEALADPLKRRNLKRTLLELGVANSLAVLAIMLASYVDDDEDPLWAVAYMDYIFTRVATEQVSSTIALPRQIGEIIENPIASAQNFYELFNVMDVFSSEEVKSGVYAGDSKSFRWIAKNIPGMKEYARLRDPKATQDTYTFYNKDVQDWAVASWYFEEDPEE